MKYIYLFIFSCAYCGNIFSQCATDYECKLENIAQIIAEKVKNSEWSRIAVLDFRTNSNTITQFCELITDDLSAELSNLTNNEKNFTIIERKTIAPIVEEAMIIYNGDEQKIAQMLKRRGDVELVITGMITEMAEEYKLTIKILVCEDGRILGSTKSKIYITKTLSEYFIAVHKKSYL